MDLIPVIRELEKEWDLDQGFLGGVRQGEFYPDKLERLVRILESVKLGNETIINKKFVSLTWYMPIFLIWQRDRFIQKGKDINELDRAINRIEGLLEQILGIP